MSLLIAALAVLALAVLALAVAVGRRIAAADRTAAPTDNLDMPAIYQQRNGALYGQARTDVRPVGLPGGPQMQKEGWPRG